MIPNEHNNIKKGASKETITINRDRFFILNYHNRKLLKTWRLFRKGC